MSDAISHATLDREYPDVLLFFALYVLVAGVPFVSLHWDLVVAIVASYYPPDVLGVAVWLVSSLLLLVGLVLADPGVERYVQFLFWPTDVVSAVVDGSYLWAAASWWAVPFLVQWVGVSPTLELYLGGVFVSHVPPLVFLTVLTTVGFAKRSDDKW